MAPSSKPPGNFLASNGKRDRVALLEKIDSWLLKQSPNRQMSHYVDISLLKRPAADLFPREWSHQIFATRYLRYKDVKDVLDRYPSSSLMFVDITEMKKTAEPYIFWSGQVSMDIDDADTIFPNYANHFRDSSESLDFKAIAKRASKDWIYDEATDKIKVNIRNLVRSRLIFLLEAIFRGTFNIDPASGKIGSNAKYRSWIMGYASGSFYSKKASLFCQLNLDDIPVRATWPTPKRTTPCENDTPKGKKHGRSPKRRSSSSKRQRRGVA
ncbi:hypothetical protein IFR05_016786 [Cadophora sp. M221]|nr:hypothetical protein IFR05_016786 [Cadophora sp. M221]